MAMFKTPGASRRALARFTAALALLIIGLPASPAMATTGHSFADSFQVGATGIAVRQSTGDVFASDPGHTDSGGNPAPRIQRFDAAGVVQSDIAINSTLYSSPASLAVDPAGAGAVYVGVTDNLTGTGAVVKYSAAGVFAYALDPAASSMSFVNPGVVAVDPVDGTVYAAATDAIGAPVIVRFDNAGAYLGTFDGSSGSPDGGFASVSSIAVDGSHRVSVVDGAKGRADRYDAAGAWQATVDDASRGGAVAVGADPVSDEVYVLESGPLGQQVSWFGAGGTARLETFGAGNIAGAAAVAVNHATGTVYTADAAAGVVERFARFDGPTVTTGAASSIDPESETLNGTIDPEGVAAEYHFDYGLDTNYGSSTPNAAAGSGSAAIPVSDTAGGLLPNTLYHARIVGSNAGGSIYGDDVTFTTAPAPPVLDGIAPLATAIKADAATLNGSVNPRGSNNTTYHFDYGTTTAYGSATLDATADVGQDHVPVAAELTGLAPGTTYHFRVSAENGTGGVQHGADQTFITAPAAPAGASSVTGVTANVTGVVNPHSDGTTYQFEYGLDPDEYGRTVAGSRTGATTVAAAIAGLAPRDDLPRPDRRDRCRRGDDHRR
jgi:hypothetical protein